MLIKNTLSTNNTLKKISIILKFIFFIVIISYTIFLNQFSYFVMNETKIIEKSIDSFTFIKDDQEESLDSQIKSLSNLEANNSTINSSIAELLYYSRLLNITKNNNYNDFNQNTKNSFNQLYNSINITGYEQEEKRFEEFFSNKFFYLNPLTWVLKDNMKKISYFF